MQSAARMMKRNYAVITNKSKHFTREEHSIHP